MTYSFYFVFFMFTPLFLPPIQLLFFIPIFDRGEDRNRENQRVLDHSFEKSRNGWQGLRLPLLAFCLFTSHYIAYRVFFIFLSVILASFSCSPLLFTWHGGIILILALIMAAAAGKGAGGKVNTKRLQQSFPVLLSFYWACVRGGVS